MSAVARKPAEAQVEAALRRELYFFNLYRVLEAGLLAFLAFSPLAGAFAEPRYPVLVQSAAATYLVLAMLLLLFGRNPRFALDKQAALGLSMDLLAAGVAMLGLVDLASGVALLLLFNVGAGALLMSLRAGLAFAITAGALAIGSYVYRSMILGVGENVAEPVMFAVTYLAIAILTHMLGRQMRATQALAERRGVEVANLAQINELIIRRMRNGVLVVDADNRIRVFNESAWFLLGKPPPERQMLGEAAPELSRRLWHWLNDKPVEATPVALAEDVPEVIPRFARLSVSDDLVVIFLEDTTALSRRAEELTLATLGRLSASIAHEIRNPLAAISYSAQLLAESEDVPEADKRLVEIINAQCSRMNGIVQSILSMARRERAQPEAIELGRWARDFVSDFRGAQQLGENSFNLISDGRGVHAMVDAQHLHQVVTILVNNALHYGRLPGKPARVTLIVGVDETSLDPQIEVIDRGPGIPPKVVESIFEPFFSTNEHGTGLGLYIARQLCEANQAELVYSPVAGGGSCFRVGLAKVHTLAGDD